MNDLFYQYNPWWEKSSVIGELIPREKYLSDLRKYLDHNQIIILTGLRRVGKTSLMKLFINELLANNIEADHIFYISLDDYLIQKNTILEIVNEFRKIHKIKIEERIIFFSTK
jgi:predicted AAA+ superfamily ATPase